MKGIHFRFAQRAGSSALGWIVAATMPVSAWLKFSTALAIQMTEGRCGQRAGPTIWPIEWPTEARAVRAASTTGGWTVAQQTEQPAMGSHQNTCIGLNVGPAGSRSEIGERRA